MSDPRAYFYLYLIGRNDDELDCKVDLTQLAERVLAGEPIRNVCAQVADNTVMANQYSGHKHDWVNAHHDEITEAGGDANRAYALYMDGQRDELASNLEQEVLDEVREILDETDFAPGTDDDDASDSDDEDATAH